MTGPAPVHGTGGKMPAWKTATWWLLLAGAVVFTVLAVAGSIQRGTWPVTIPMMVVTAVGSVFVGRLVAATPDGAGASPASRLPLVLGIAGVLVMAGVLVYLYV